MFQLPGKFQLLDSDPETPTFEEFHAQEIPFDPPDPTPEIVADAIDSLEELARILDEDIHNLHHFADRNADTPSRADVKMALQE